MALNPAMIAICVGEIKDAVHKATGLEAKIKTAFRFVQSFWLTTDTDVRWNGALAAVIMDPSITNEEKATLTRSSRALMAVAAATRGGSQADLAAIVEEAERDGILPLRGWWIEAETAEAARPPDLDVVQQLVKEIGPRLAHKPPPIQGAVLADLLAIWLAGHVLHNGDAIDREATAKLRDDILQHHVEKVLELVPVNAQAMGIA